MKSGGSLVGKGFSASNTKAFELAERKKARADLTARRKNVVAANRELRSKLSAAGAICSTQRASGRQNAQQLREQAKMSAEAAKDWCKNRKSSALRPGDAAQDCAAVKRRAATTGKTLRAKASSLQAKVSFDCSTRRENLVSASEAELLDLLNKLEDAQDTVRMHREKTKRSTVHANTKRAATREKFTEEFSPENAEFCRANKRQIKAEIARSKRRGLTLQPHEACDEVAERDKANWMAQKGDKFETPAALKEFERQQEQYYRDLGLITEG